MKLQTCLYFVYNFLIYQLKDMAFSIFCYFLKIVKSRTDDVTMTSSLGSASVDHRFVAHDRNWSRGLVPLGRGGREEQGERRIGPNGRRSMAGGDHGAAAATVHGDDGLERERRKGEVSIRSRCSPRARWRGRRGVGRTVAAARSSAEPRPWRRRPGRCRRLRAPRHGPVAPRGRGDRGGPGRHIRRARGGAGRRRFAGDAGGSAAVR